MQLGEHAGFERVVDRGVTKEGSFLGQQALEQRFVFDVGFAHSAQQIGSVREVVCAQMFAHARGEEPRARFV
jgi:hypothetical protein